MKSIFSASKAFLLLLAGTLLFFSSCDSEGQDVVPASFADFKLLPDHMWSYVEPDFNSLLRLDPIFNDSIKVAVNVTFSTPKNGQFVVENDGQTYYLPNQGYRGLDSLTYTVCSDKACKTEKIKLYLEAEPNPQNCAFSLANDVVSTPKNQWVDIRIHLNDNLCDPYNQNYETEFPGKGMWEDISYSGNHPNNRVFRYYPPKDYVGVDSFKYRVFDGAAGEYKEATVTIHIQ